MISESYLQNDPTDDSFHRQSRGHHGFGCDVGDGHVPGGDGKSKKGTLRLLNRKILHQ